MASNDQKQLARAADFLREICHAKDVAIVIDDHFRMVETHGLDGVHLSDGSRSIREARKLLGADAIIGAYCGGRHAGMTAAEIGVDYVSFGPLKDDGALGGGEIAASDLFQWWSEMIEVPVVAEGGTDAESITAIKDSTDFICVGDEIWQSDDPHAALKELLKLL